MVLSSGYPLDAENLYCVPPSRCGSAGVLFLGSAIGLGSVPYLLKHAADVPPSEVVVADAGPLDQLTHLAHVSGFSRGPFLQLWSGRFGGKLVAWGLSTPRPGRRFLERWPYDLTDIERRFSEVEASLGVLDPIPFSGRHLETVLLSRLAAGFPDSMSRVAPLAINRDGARWCPLIEVPRLAEQGVRLLPRFRCTRLLRAGSRIVGVDGVGVDGRSYTLRPESVVLAVGLEQSLPLLRQVANRSLPLSVADHLRIDLHGRLPGDTFGPGTSDDLGVAVLLMECISKSGLVPYHLEVKIAPRALWRRGYMQSSDNLHGGDDDGTLYVQIQAIAAMHDRLPAGDLLQVEGLHPVMSARDASFHGEIIEKMRGVAGALGLKAPTFNLRPLLTNHHQYGAFRVGGAVSRTFRWEGLDNLWVLPPASYVDSDDDANPTLKSLVLSQYAMEDIANSFSPALMYTL
jgi:hypothetical protein